MKGYREKRRRSRKYLELAIGALIVGSLGSLAAYGVYRAINREPEPEPVPEPRVFDPYVPPVLKLRATGQYIDPGEKSMLPREQLVKKARDGLKGFDSTKRNIAVCGVARSGKSTLINSLRGIKEGSKDAAFVGEQSGAESITISNYPVKGSNIVLWDIPGFDGTTPFTDYFDRMKLYAFDELILVYTSGICTNVINLYKHCIKRKIPVILVSTIADKTFNLKTRRMTVENAINEMRGDFDHEIDELGLVGTPNAYLVSMWDYMDGGGKMDEQKFVNRILKPSDDV